MSDLIKHPPNQDKESNEHVLFSLVGSHGSADNADSAIGSV